MHHHFTGNRDLLYNLAIVLALFTVFAWCVRRGFLQAKEIAWVGAALAFFATSLVFNSALLSTRSIYGVRSAGTLLGITALLTVPLVLALTYGIVALYRSSVVKELAALTVNGLTLRLVLGNIAALKRPTPLDALVNPASPDLRMGAGVAGTLKSFGGAIIEREARAQAPLALGKAVATTAGRLLAQHVIHAVVMGKDRQIDLTTIQKALDGALRCAKKINARRIALPAFGTGIGSTPAASVAPLTVQTVLRVQRDFDEIAIIVPNRRFAAAFQAEFAALAAQYPPDTPPQPSEEFRV